MDLYTSRSFGVGFTGFGQSPTLGTTNGDFILTAKGNLPGMNVSLRAINTNNWETGERATTGVLTGRLPLTPERAPISLGLVGGMNASSTLDSFDPSAKVLLGGSLGYQSFNLGVFRLVPVSDAPPSVVVRGVYVQDLVRTDLDLNMAVESIWKGSLSESHCVLYIGLGTALSTRVGS